MKKIFLLGLLLCAAVPAPCAAVLQDGGHADTYYRDGARLALEGRLAEAAKAFEQAVALDPSNGNAYYGLGNVYAELGRWAEAVNSYYKAVSLNKDDVEAYNNLGVALGMRGQYVQAAAAFEKAVRIYPKWAEPYYHLSEARRALGQEAEAREAYERAIRLRPDYAARPPRRFALTNAQAAATPPRSQILEAMNAVNLGAGGGERAAAGERAATAATPRPTPNAGTPSSNAGPASSTPATPSLKAGTRSANAAGPSGAATPNGTPAATRPTTPPATTRPTAPAATTSNATRPAATASTEAASPYEIGLREARAGRYREAVAALRQAVLLDRGNAAVYRALGDAYAALGDWRQAVDAYEQAARLAPEDAETYQKLGRSYAKLREMDAAAGDGSGAAAESAKAAPQPAATPGGARPAEDDPDPTAVYRVGSGDVLDIRVLDGRENRTTSYGITPTGLLDYPGLAEPLSIAGLTTEQVAARLGAALKLRAAGPSPEIAVGVREYASHAVIVGGMVKDAGTKILQREGVPLYVIIAYAQPLPGAGQALLFARATGRTTAVDLSDTTAMKTLVRPGDVITVRPLPKQFVYVAGAVRQPGQKEFHAGMTLTQLLLAAGGAEKPDAAVVAVTRQVDDGRLSTSRYRLAEIKAGRVPDPPLSAGDRVEVLR